MKRYHKPPPRWTPQMQAAAERTKQAVRDATPAEDREDRRPALTLLIAPDEGAPLVHWRLTPIRGQIRRYRVTDAATGDMVFVDGERVGGGKDEILRAAAKLLPKYAAIGQFC